MNAVRRILLAPLLPLSLQGAAAFGLWWLAEAAYGGARQIGELAETVLLHALLLVLGPIAFVLAAMGLYRLHRDQPIGRAIAATLLFVPSLLLAASASCVALMFAGLG